MRMVQLCNTPTPPSISRAWQSIERKVCAAQHLARVLHELRTTNAQCSLALFRNCTL